MNSKQRDSGLSRAARIWTREAIQECIAQHAFGHEFASLCERQRKIVAFYAGWAIDFTDTPTINYVSMTDEERKAAESTVATLTKKLAEVEAKNAKEIQEIKRARQSIIDILGIKESVIANTDHLHILGLSNYEAAKYALAKLGKAATLNEIAAFLSDNGYKPGMATKSLINSLYVGIKRKPSEFRMNKTTEKWNLVAAEDGE